MTGVSRYFLRQRRQRVGDLVQVLLDQRQALAHLQHRRRVGDVLRGGAPVAVLAELVAAVGVDLVDDGDDRVADLLGLGLELDPVDLRQLAVADDLVGRLLRDDAEFALDLGQGALDVEVLGGAVLVGPDVAHRASLNMSPKMRESMMVAGIEAPVCYRSVAVASIVNHPS